MSFLPHSKCSDTLLYFNVNKTNETNQYQLSPALLPQGKPVRSQRTNLRQAPHTHTHTDTKHVFHVNCYVHLLSPLQQANVTAVSGIAIQITWGHVTKRVTVPTVTLHTITSIVIEEDQQFFCIGCYTILRQKNSNIKIN